MKAKVLDAMKARDVICMAHRLKLVALILLVLLTAGALFAQDQPTKAAWPAYYLSFFLGFGTGQYYLGENGTPFLVGEVIGGAGFLAGAAVFVYVHNLYVQNLSPSAAGYFLAIGLGGAGALVYVVFRLLEVLDVFGAVDRAKEAGRVVEVVPIVDVRRTSFDLGISLKY